MLTQNLNVFRLRLKMKAAYFNADGCTNPYKCVINVGVKTKLGLAHGYVKVDAKGVKITRDGQTHREFAVMPPEGIALLKKYDACQNKDGTVDYAKLGKLANSKLPTLVFDFYPDTPVVKLSRKRMDQINRARRGKPTKAYGMRRRVDGLTETTSA